jgi:hypothetical protein
MEMKLGEQSLRLLVEKWLAPSAATPVHVTRSSRIHASQKRSVLVETIRPEGAVAIFFFWHEDGTWRVFPPAAPYPTMRAYEHVL